jgi:hypothetical protein
MKLMLIKVNYFTNILQKNVNNPTHSVSNGEIQLTPVLLLKLQR